MKPKHAPPAASRTRGLGRRQLLAGVPGLALLPVVPVARLAAGEPGTAAAAQDLPDWVRRARAEVRRDRS